MDRRRIILAAVVLALAFAVPMVGRAAPGDMCMGQRGVAGGSYVTVRCTLASAGDLVNLRASTSAAGAYTVFMFPFPPITNVSVSIAAADGRTLLSCSSTELVVAQCAKQAPLHLPTGTPLTCTVRGWTNMDVGIARMGYACMTR
jgi:hypothetical protein